VATTVNGSAARPSSAAWTSRPSSWNSEEVVTSTIGPVISRSQARRLGRRVPVARTDHRDGVGPVPAGVLEGLGGQVQDQRRSAEHVIDLLQRVKVEQAADIVQ